MSEKNCWAWWLWLDELLWTYIIEFINDSEFVLKSLKTNEIQFRFTTEKYSLNVDNAYNDIQFIFKKDTTNPLFKNLTWEIIYNIKSIFKKDPNLIYFIVWALGIGIYYLMRYFFHKKVSKK